MGEIVSMILNGLLCEKCGSYVDGEEPGYPRKCYDCQKEEGYHPQMSKKKGGRYKPRKRR